jgi:hypothetical protein
VRFISDGVVFIGSGSEWFWAAVSGLALAVTFIAIYRQLRLQRLQMRENTKVLRSQAHFMQFNGWEYCYYQYRDESIPKELWVGTDNTLRAWIDTKPGLARFWSEARVSFDEPFRSEVDQQFARKPAPKVR